METHSDRVIQCTVKVKNEKPLQIIQAYAPQSGRPDEEAERFYETLHAAIDRNKCNLFPPKLSP